MVDERFDVMNERMEIIGQASRREVHARGLWHQTFHCWIVQRTGDGSVRLLLQLRHQDKDTNPNTLDTSCAGHLLAGETPKDGVRELEEELGLGVLFEALAFCGTVAQEDEYDSGLIDREFNHVYVYACSQPLEAYKYQVSEVSGLFLADLEAFKALLDGTCSTIRINGIIHDEHTGVPKPETREIAVKDLTPHSEAYYRLLFEGLEGRQ